jgi:RNA polymerase sigma factor (sigma-70 family)
MENTAWTKTVSETEEQIAEQFVSEFGQPLYRLACAMLNDPIEAAEAAQEALLAALEHRNSFTGSAKLSTWVYTIGLNECRNRLRKRKARLRLDTLMRALFALEKMGSADPETCLVKGEEDLRVWKAVQSLDEPHRLVVILRYYQELPAREIAQILHLNEGTVHSRLNTARARLRAHLKPLDVGISIPPPGEVCDD